MNKIVKGIGQILIMVTAFVIVIISSLLIAQSAVGLGMAHVRGDSMEPNLKDGQVYMYTERSPIKRYDVVLSEFADSGGNKILVKRVVGIPGDDLSVINGNLYIDKLYYEEPYVVNDSPEFEKESFRKKLGPDEYFLMGDNRDHSLDSRDDLGIVHRDNIIGVLKRDITNLRKGVEDNE